ncbi:restriction endonuclease subunit S [Parvimonas micra]|uniref:restriction endonuclease subunit S n=1 Tax=Parvimonas micra TaxID=33033 RepID=UPI000A8FC6D6|nr:restriction endonuclease subunit S [Parvimonas micra]
MSKIDKLLKNEKVEWKKLGEVCNIKRGRVISKIYLEEHKGEFPVYSSQTRNNGEIGRISTYDFDGEFATWTTDGAYAGTVFYRNGKFSVTNICGLIEPKDNKKLSVKFIVYWLQIEAKKHVKGGSGNPKLMSNVVERIKIPIPSIETQEKIVKTLDKFTNYVTELQSELQSRTKQYEYYRDMLLSEEYLNKLSCHLEENRLLKLEWKTLDEISVGSLSYGSGASAIDYDGETRYIRITDINDSGGLNKEKASPNVVEEKYILNNEDILFARSGATVGKNYIHLINDKCIYAGYLIRLIVNREIALPKFVFYCLNTNRYKIFVDNTKSRGSQPNINAKQYGSFKIPIIPIEIQNKVVEILDKFRSLLADTKGLLPKEIEQRQKQYEYYREKLLTFDENSVKRERERAYLSNSYLNSLKEVGEIVGVTVFGVELKKLEDFAKIYDGTHQTPKYVNIGVPFVSVQDIKNIYGTNKYITIEEYNKFKVKPRKNDVFMTRIGDIGTCAIVKNDDDLAYYVTLALIRPSNDIVLSKFLKYLIESNQGKKELSKRILHNATPIKINLGEIGKLKFFIPSIPVQEHIVSILDKFDNIVNNISKGLPKEIELRQKQYEYYREKLLSFDR